MNDERSKVQRVATGVAGHGVLRRATARTRSRSAKLAATIKALPKKLDRATMAAVIKRVDSVSQSLASLPIPKGIDPTKARAPRPR